MRFTDFLKATVLISAGAATVLATLTVVAAGRQNDNRVVFIGVGWWILAAVVGTVVGRRSQTSPAIERLLAGARSSAALPELRPGRVLVNRLWPLVVATGFAGGLGFVVPQAPAIGCGFAIIWSLAWRRQEPAVTAIEERDGARFYVEKTSPVEPIRLTRTPGFRAVLPPTERSAKPALDGGH